MLFFKRILDVRKTSGDTINRRAASRFVVNPGFPVVAVLNIAGRDEFGRPLSKAKRGEGWDSPVQLINLSTTGARVQVPLTVKAQRDDFCRLKLDVQGYQLIVPGRIAHVAADGGSHVFGLVLDLGAANTAAGYRQLIDLVALGSSLILTKASQPDDSGYNVEEYTGEPASRLSIWRSLASGDVIAFEFQLKDCLVRGHDGSTGVECFTGTDAKTAQPAKTEQAEEIKRLFQWVVLNLAPAVPADVREFLQSRAT
jgi:hypothetical protein